MNFNETNRLESSSTWYFCNLVAFFFFFFALEKSQKSLQFREI